MREKDMKLYWYKREKNFGDAIAPIILEHFTGKAVEFAGMDERGKYVSTGSVITAAREGDTIWGSGLIRAYLPKMPKANYLAVRGPLTKDFCRLDVKVFGDPGILLPLIYRPAIEKKHKVGIIPHYIDKGVKNIPEGYLIDIQADWTTVIDEILSCEMIFSSSLHGIIAAEAYGIPAVWMVLSNNVIGNGFKFQDYFLGTGRSRQLPNILIPKILDLESRQQKLIEALLWKK